MIKFINYDQSGEDSLPYENTVPDLLLFFPEDLIINAKAYKYDHGKLHFI